MSFPTTPLDQVQRRSGVLLLVGIIALLAALAVRLHYINMALRPRLVAIADRQQHGSSVIPARRGMIFDARGRVVALSLTCSLIPCWWTTSTSLPPSSVRV